MDIGKKMTCTARIRASCLGKKSNNRVRGKKKHTGGRGKSLSGWRKKKRDGSCKYAQAQKTKGSEGDMILTTRGKKRRMHRMSES